MINLNRIKKWLYGSSFTKLLEQKKTNKYRISRDVDISYQTLLNWEAGRNRPTDKSAMLVAGYLNLISNDDMITELERQAAEINAWLEALK